MLLVASFFYRCIPNYWKVKDMSNLSDSKKKEVNDLNQTMLGLLSKEFDYLAESKTADGQIFIRLGVVGNPLYPLVSFKNKDFCVPSQVQLYLLISCLLSVGHYVFPGYSFCRSKWE